MQNNELILYRCNQDLSDLAKETATHKQEETELIKSDVKGGYFENIF
jgi:hypothetical protein